MTRRRAALPKREPNGRHDRALDRLVDARSPTEIRRLRDAALAGLRAPEWGSELGRLFLETKLTAAQFEAGRRFSVLAREYHAALGAPGYPSSSPGQNGNRGHTEAPPDTERLQAAIRYYDDAIARLRASPCQAVVQLVCERDATVAGRGALVTLQAGLDILAAHWGIPP